MANNDIKENSGIFTKLLDIIASGIGTLYEPTKIKKEAKAKSYELQIMAEAQQLADKIKADTEAYRIGVLSDAVRHNLDLPIDMKSDGTIQIDVKDTNELVKRARIRIAKQELTKQYNIECVCENAYDYLKTVVSEEENIIDDYEDTDPIDASWSSDFFKCAAEISDKDLQRIWGKLLTREVRSPQSYSLRTLQVLRYLSKNEALLFQSICSFVINHEFIFLTNEICRKFGIKYSDILKLEECNLIHATFKQIKVANLYNDSLYMHVAMNDSDSKIEIKVIKLAEAGKQLLGIVDFQKNNEYFVYVCNEIKRRLTRYSYGLYKIQSFTSKSITYDETFDYFEHPDQLEEIKKQIN